MEVRKSNVATPVAAMATLQRTLGRSVAMVLPAAAVADGREKARKRDEALQAALFVRDDSQRQCAPQNVMKNRRQERMMMTDKGHCSQRLRVANRRAGIQPRAAEYSPGVI